MLVWIIPSFLFTTLTVSELTAAGQNEAESRIWLDLTSIWCPALHILIVRGAERLKWRKLYLILNLLNQKNLRNRVNLKKTRSKWSIDAIKTDMISKTINLGKNYLFQLKHFNWKFQFSIWIKHLISRLEFSILIQNLNSIFKFNIWIQYLNSTLEFNI